MVLAQEIKVSIGIFIYFKACLDFIRHYLESKFGEKFRQALRQYKNKRFLGEIRIIKNIFYIIHADFKSFSYLYSLLEK